MKNNKNVRAFPKLLASTFASVATLFTFADTFAYDITLTPLPAFDDPCYDAFRSASLTEAGAFVSYGPYFFDANNTGCPEAPVPKPFYQFDVNLQQGERIAPAASQPNFSATAVSTQESGRYTAVSGVDRDATGQIIDSGVYLRDNTTQLFQKLPQLSGFLNGWDISQSKVQTKTTVFGPSGVRIVTDHEFDITASTLSSTLRPVASPSSVPVELQSEDGSFDIIQVSNTLLQRDNVTGQVQEIETIPINGLSPSSVNAQSLSTSGNALVWQAYYDLPSELEPVSYLFRSDLISGNTVVIPGSESCPRDINRLELPLGNFCGSRAQISGNGRFVAFVQASSKVGPNPVNPPIGGTVHPRSLVFYDTESNASEVAVENTCSAYWDDQSLPSFCLLAGFVTDLSFDGLSMLLINGDSSAFNNPFYETLPTLIEITPSVIPVPEVRISSRPVYEGDSSPAIALNLSRASANPVSVTIESMNGEATAIDDYVALQQTVSFNPGETHVSIPISLIDDQITEDAERFTVRITNATGADIAVDRTAVLVRDDDISRTVSIANLTVNEWETDFRPNDEIPVTLSASADTSVFVYLAIREGTAELNSDFRILTSVVQFDPGETTKFIPIDIRDDQLSETTETFEVEIIGVTAGTQIGNSLAVVTINDNDVPPSGNPGIRIGDSLANEDNAPYDEEITLLLSPVSTQAVTVTATTRSGSAAEGSDFVASTQTVTFAPGEDFKSIPVTILDDGLSEGRESFSVEITNATGAAINDAVARVTIADGAEDPNQRWVKFAPASQSNYVVSEANGVATVNLQLLGDNDQIVNVDVRTRALSATEGADYIFTTQTVSFLPGDRTATLNVPIVQDQTVESGETFVVEILSVEGAIIRDPDDAVTMIVILDDDETTLVPELSINDVTVTEGDGVVQVPVLLSQASSQDVTVSVFTRNVTAQGGQDFYGFTKSVTIPAGATTANVSLTVLDDATAESTETLQLRLFNEQGATVVDNAGTVSILDNDQQTIPDLSIDDVSVSEDDGTVLVPVRLSQVSSQPVTVSVFTRSISAQGGQDYFGFTKSVSIPAGATSANVSLTLRDDAVPENSETMQLRLFGAQGATIVDNAGTVTILDDDQPTALELTIDDASISEGDGIVQVPIRLSQAGSQAVTVSVFTRSISAQGGQDYYGFTKSVTIPAGAIAANVSLTVLDDTAVESVETMQLRLFDAQGATIVDGVGTISINDND